MPSNPYLEADADDDLLTRPHGERHALDGTPCERCNGRVHSAYLPEGVPDDVLDQVSDMLDRLPAEVLEAASIIVSGSTPNKSQLLASFVDYATDINGLHREGPLLRAVAEVLNEQSGGEVERRWRVYETERELLVAHTILQSLNQVSEAVRDMDMRANKPAHETNVVLELLDDLLASTIEHRDESAQHYREACVVAGNAVDERMIEEGLATGEVAPLSSFAMAEMFDRALKDFIRKSR